MANDMMENNEDNMIKAIYLEPRKKCNFMLHLQSTYNQGEFIGAVDIETPRDTLTSLGEFSWADYIGKYGVAIIDDEQDYKSYYYVVNRKVYRLGDLIKSKKLLSEFRKQLKKKEDENENI